jgi:uncharacterized protein (DUF1697 family)
LVVVAADGAVVVVLIVREALQVDQAAALATTMTTAKELAAQELQIKATQAEASPESMLLF